MNKNNMPKPPTCDELMDKWRAREASFSEMTSSRVRRSISWICRAEKAGEDKAMRFISLWIAFNAAYAVRHSPSESSERDQFNDFLEKIVRLDSHKRIYRATYENFKRLGSVESLIRNPFVYFRFWKDHYGESGYQDWKSLLRDDEHRFNGLIEQPKYIIRVLKMVFDRLYVLRNQIMHGSARWRGQAKYPQVTDGVAILDLLMPIFVDLMMDNPDQDWGELSYPFINDDSIAFSRA